MSAIGRDVQREQALVIGPGGGRDTGTMARPLYVIYGHHKCATMWLEGIARHVAQVNQRGGQVFARGGGGGEREEEEEPTR